MNCHVCRKKGKPEILEAIGLTFADLFAERGASWGRENGQRWRQVAAYPYEDLDGNLLSEKVRYEPKSFKWRSPLPGGKWSWTRAKAVTIYRLPHLIDARRVLVVEGEKSVERLAALGFAATCPPSGASVWLPAYGEALWRAGCYEAVVIPDNDAPGRKHAKRVVEACHGFRPTVTECATDPELPWSCWPFPEPGDEEVKPLTAKLLELAGVPHAGDVCDWLDADHTAIELRALIECALDPDAMKAAKREHKRKVDRERQRRYRARRRALLEG